MRDHDELRALGEPAHEPQEAVDVDVVERRLDLIEDVEGARPGHQNGEDEGQRDQRLLASGEQRQPPRRLAGRCDLDLDAAVLIGGAELLALLPLPVSLLRLLAGKGPGCSRHVDPAKAPASAGEELRDHLLEAAGRRLEGLLERRRDLAVGTPDQRPQLRDRLLEVLALLGELADVILRLLVLSLRQWVDRPDLLAIALQLGQACVDRLALVFGQSFLRRRNPLAERCPEPLELGRALVAARAQLGGLDLRDRHRLACVPELGLQPELLLRALAELGGDVGAVIAFDRRQARGAALQGRNQSKQRFAHDAERRQRLLLERDAPFELLAVAQSLLLGACGGLGVAALGRQLGLELGALDCSRSRALIGALGMALSEPGGPIRLLRRLVQRTARLAERSLGAVLALGRLRQRGLRTLEVTPRSLIRLLSLREPRRQLLALGPGGEGRVGALP